MIQACLPCRSGQFTSTTTPRRRCCRKSSRPCAPAGASRASTRPASTNLAAAPAAVLEDARERIGELLGRRATGMHADRVIFTSGGTEANNLAIRGLASDGRGHYQRVTCVGPPAPDTSLSPPSNTPASHALADELSRHGWHVDRLARRLAMASSASTSLADLIRAETRLVAAMLGQNETGVLQPVAELAAICATARRSAAHRCRPSRRQTAGQFPRTWASPR